MIGIIVITHGDLGQELIKTSELIIGRQEKLIAYGLHQGDDVENLYKTLENGIKDLDDGSGVLVLTDLFGGSPSNVTAANIRNYQFESLTGVNLSMLIEALSSRVRCNLTQLAELCMDSGICGIKNLKIMVEKKVKVGNN